MSTEALPSYTNPPVVEVVVAIAFQRLERLTIAQIADFWSSVLSKTFPRVEEQPPYVPPVEQFGVVGQAVPIPITLLGAFPSPRLWCLTEDGQELIQLQRDWFACNWRKVAPENQYGRWASRRDALTKWWLEFQRFAAENDLGDLQPTQCEVTYINHIPVGDIGGNQGELAPLIRFVANFHEGFLPTPEQTQMALHFVIPGEDGTPIGRLHADLQPALRREDGAPLIVLTLTARGRPETPDFEGAMRFLDRGRKWVVNSFADLTTDDIQRRWGRNA
jgi:uncharacterized protein (TIGR04255 family)